MPISSKDGSTTSSGGLRQRMFSHQARAASCPGKLPTAGATASVTKNLSVGVSYVGVDGNSINSFSNDAVVGTLKYSF